MGLSHWGLDMAVPVPTIYFTQDFIHTPHSPNLPERASRKDQEGCFLFLIVLRVGTECKQAGGKTKLFLILTAFPSTHPVSLRFPVPVLQRD